MSTDGNPKVGPVTNGGGHGDLETANCQPREGLGKDTLRHARTQEGVAVINAFLCKLWRKQNQAQHRRGRRRIRAALRKVGWRVATEGTARRDPLLVKGAHEGG